MLRGALGSLSWLTGQTVFIFAADVNILLTKIPTSTINEINETNKLIRNIKKTADQVYKIHAFPPEEELELAVGQFGQMQLMLTDQTALIQQRAFLLE